MVLLHNDMVLLLFLMADVRGACQSSATLNSRRINHRRKFVSQSDQTFRVQRPWHAQRESHSSGEWRHVKRIFLWALFIMLLLNTGRSWKWWRNQAGLWLGCWRQKRGSVCIRSSWRHTSTKAERNTDIYGQGMYSGNVQSVQHMHQKLFKYQSFS